MKKIVVIFGGNSVEHDVSIVTGLQAVANLSGEYKVYSVYISLDNEFYLTREIELNKYKDKTTIIKNSKKIVFYENFICKVLNKKIIKLFKIDGVVNCCHGGVGENGELYAYMKMSKTDITSAPTTASQICMNKYLTKLFVNSLGIETAKGVLIRKDNLDAQLDEIKKSFDGALIVKPNKLGSSIGVMSATKDDLEEKVKLALNLDDEVLVEEKIGNMVELNCGAYLNSEKIVISQIEKVGNKSKILSFDDKYCTEKDERELPANISQELEEKIKEYTKVIYFALSMKGVIRIDYMYNKKTKQLYLNEVNTVPGSLAFYLFSGNGIGYLKLCRDCLNTPTIEKKQTYFESNILAQKGLKGKKS